MGYVPVVKYCVTCGAKMSKTVSPIDRYDEDTGKREVILTFVCPKYSFWRFGHYDVVINTLTHLKDIPTLED